LRSMSGSLSCRVERLSSAYPAVVYDVLMDVERWSDWMPTVSAASWERQGEPDSGRGGIRRVRTGISVTRDRVVGGMRPHHHAYAASLPRYWPLKDYRGDVRIEDRPNGSLIIWTVTCESRIPGLGKSLQSRLCAVYTRLAAALAQEAERAGASQKRETR
jgi:hypothetical protein